MDLRHLSLRHRSLLASLGTKAFTAGGTAKGTAAGSVKTVSTVTYIHDGIFRSKGATDNIALTGAPFTAMTCFFLVSLDKAGTVVVTRGVASGEAVTQNSVGRAGDVPNIPNGTGQNGDAQPNCPICIIKVVAAAATTFTPGTTNVDAASITTTFYDVSGVPEKGNVGL